MGVEINEFDTLQNKFNHIAKNYPYESEILLTKMGNKFRNSVKSKIPDSEIERMINKLIRGLK